MIRSGTDLCQRFFAPIGGEGVIGAFWLGAASLAKEMQAARRRGEDLGLTEEELAFYDALETNDSAVQVLFDEQLRAIARELAEDGAGECDDRLDRAGKRAGESAGAGRAEARGGMATRPTSRRRRRERWLAQAELWEKRVGGVSGEIG